MLSIFSSSLLFIFYQIFLISNILAQTNKTISGYQHQAVWPTYRGNQFNTGQSSHLSIPLHKNLTSWRFYNKTFSAYQNPSIDASGNLIIAATNFLISVSPKGVLNWSSKLTTPTCVTQGCAVYFPVIDAAGTIYVSGDPTLLYAINGTTGVVIWKSFLLAAPVINAPAIGSNGDLFVGATDGSLYRISSLGTLKWKKSISSQIFASPVLDNNDNIYVGGTVDKSFYSVFPNGTLRWKYFGAAGFSSTAAVNNQLKFVYAASQGSCLYIFTFDGYPMRCFNTITFSLISAPVIGPNGVVYTAVPGYLFALSPTLSKALWATGTNFSTDSTPALTQGGLLYVNSLKVLKIYNATNGNLIKTLSHSPDATVNLGGINSPAVASNDIVYVTTESDVVAIFNGTMPIIPTSAPVSTPVPYTFPLVYTVGVAFAAVAVAVIIFILVIRHIINENALKLLSQSDFFSEESIQQAKNVRDRVKLMGRVVIEGGDIASIPTDGKYNIDSSTDIGSTASTNRSADFFEQNIFEWSGVTIEAEDPILGEGTFGVVIRAMWDRNAGTDLPSKEVEVAIKVVKTPISTMDDASRDKIIEEVIQEVTVLKNAELALHSDCVVKVFGVAVGNLPSEIARCFNVTAGNLYIGMLLKFEAGGSLAGYIRPNDQLAQKLTLSEKMDLVVKIANGLSELHAAGIVHGDIKPENILLSGRMNPEIRFADFGLAAIRDKEDMADTLAQTSHLKGTPKYCAPEMLFDSSVAKSTVARSSRKTDVYAFALLTWEILTQKQPFDHIKNEAALCSAVHKGERPPISELPTNTPPSIIQLIENGWSKDRALRPPALHFYSIAFSAYNILASKNSDIFFSHVWTMKYFLRHVFAELVKGGYKVWYDENDMGMDLKAAMTEGIANSSVFVVFLNSTYQTRPNCMYELREAKRLNKTIITVILDPYPTGPNGWANEEILEICELASKMYVDVSSLRLSDAWEAMKDSEEEASKAMLHDLREAMTPLAKILREANCLPSLSKTKKRGSNATGDSVNSLNSSYFGDINGSRNINESGNSINNSSKSINISSKKLNNNSTKKVNSSSKSVLTNGGVFFKGGVATSPKTNP